MGLKRPSWRKILRLYELFDSLIGAVPAPELHQTYVPLLLQHLELGPATLKPAAALHLALAFAGTCAAENRIVLSQSLARVLRLASHESSHARKAFVLVAAAMAQRLGYSFFVTHFMQPVVSCAADRIESVAVEVVRQLSNFPSACQGGIRAAAERRTPPLAVCADDSSRPATDSEGVVRSPLADEATEFMCHATMVEKVQTALRRMNSQAQRNLST